MSDWDEVLAGARVVPVLTVAEAADAVPLAHALVARGYGGPAEVTLRTAAAWDAVAALSTVPGLVVGVGTVTTPGQVVRAQAVGARFIVSPGLSEAVVATAQECGLPVLPGVATPTELMAALRCGVDVVKFFPAEALGGVAAVRALSAAFPAVRFVPTGGIDGESAPSYLALPAVLAVGGSWMVPVRSDLGDPVPAAR